ncbi:hypothetical protein CSUI_001536, partial [Cystoisospora suis]
QEVGCSPGRRAECLYTRALCVYSSLYSCRISFVRMHREVFDLTQAPPLHLPPRLVLLLIRPIFIKEGQESKQQFLLLRRLHLEGL